MSTVTIASNHADAEAAEKVEEHHAQMAGRLALLTADVLRAARTDLAETVTTRATAWAPTTALPGGTAQWRVVALDAAGQSLSSSPWRDFVVVDPPRVVAGPGPRWTARITTPSGPRSLT